VYGRPSAGFARRTSRQKGRSCASDKSNIDESDPQICPLLAPKLSHRLDNRDLKRRSNVAAKEVTSPHAAVAQSEHSVEMQAGLAVVSLRDVAEQTQYLALLVDGDWIVSLGGEIEPPDLGAPIAVTDAPLMAFSFAKAVIVAKASSP